MSEVSTSRRAVMRALAILPAALVTPPAAHAAVEMVRSPAGDAGWAALLAEERWTAAASRQAGIIADEAFSRYSKARDAFMKDWQSEWDDKHGKPHKFIDARPAHEQGDVRVAAGIVDYNAFPRTMEARRDAATAALNDEHGVMETEDRYYLAHDAHVDAIQALIAYPSRDPDIIAHKLRLLIEQFGDEESDLRPLLNSITGEA